MLAFQLALVLGQNRPLPTCSMSRVVLFLSNHSFSIMSSWAQWHPILGVSVLFRTPFWTVMDACPSFLCSPISTCKLYFCECGQSCWGKAICLAWAAPNEDKYKFSGNKKIALKKAYRRQQGKKKQTDCGDECNTHTINHTNFSQRNYQGLRWLVLSRMLMKDVGLKSEEEERINHLNILQTRDLNFYFKSRKLYI